MRFSVVIPTYNRVRLLPRALQSVWAQRFTDYEVIVVDDGSTDGTNEYLQSLGTKLRGIRQANRGPGAARNAGARAARGEYVAFLDSDDLWFPWTLEVFARAIAAHSGSTIIAGHLIEFGDDAEICNVREESYAAAYFPDYLASSGYPYYVGSGTCAVRRDAFAGAHFLEDRLNAEDHDLTLQMGTRPGFVRILAPVTLAWRRHAQSETADFASTAAGALRLLARERAGIYPGGAARARARRRITARYVRPVALACLREGDWKSAWGLYRATFGWHLSLGNAKFLAGFPVLAALALAGDVLGRTRRHA
jgi:GT2 family glycosyltransferase